MNNSNSKPGKLPPAILNGSIVNPDLAAFTRFVREARNGWDILDLMTEGFSWPEEQIIKDSPKAVPANPILQVNSVLSLFPKNDLVWCGNWNEKEQSYDGKWAMQRLLASKSRDWSVVCPVTVPEYGRLGRPEVVRRFLVVQTEGPTDYLDEGVLLRWLHLGLKMDLRAVVRGIDGHLEGWFVAPDQVVFESLFFWLPKMELCHSDSFDTDIPATLPGGEYNLIYLAK